MGLFIPAVIGSAILSVGWLVYTVVYRLFFHPCAKFPGPKLNGITPIPSIISLLKGRLPLDEKKWHDMYGPVVRVGPTVLSFNTAQAWEDIYGFRQGGINMHKDPIRMYRINVTFNIDADFAPDVGSVDPIPGVTTLTMADDHNHARQRRALAYSFSQKALSEQEDIVRGYVDTMISKLKLKADKNEVFNLVDWL
jgi:hypothetical protein